jgi:hypothetical protein
MERQTKHPTSERHDSVKETYDEVESDGRFEEGMARMAVYHRHCQDPVISYGASLPGWSTRSCGRAGADVRWVAAHGRPTSAVGFDTTEMAWDAHRPAAATAARTL